MTRRRIVFHIGLAKTGTTSFQHFCHRARGFLKRRGVLYPRHELGRSHNHSPLVASYIAHRSEGPTVALAWRSRAAAVQSLRKEIEASDAGTVLISSEHFSMHFDRSEALELASDFGAYDCSIVIVLRDPHARFLSAYNTHVTAGGHLPVEVYARSVLIPGTRHMSVRETVLIWQEAFGRDRLHIVDYDATTDVAAAILGICGIDGPLPVAAHARRRVSLGPATVESLRAANAVIATRQRVRADRNLAAWAQLSLFSILCRSRLARSGRGSGRRDRWAISHKTMQALDETATVDRRFIAETYGVSLCGGAARNDIDVADDPWPPSDEDIRRAEALVDRVTVGLWMPTHALVALWTWIAGPRSAAT